MKTKHVPCAKAKDMMTPKDAKIVVLPDFVCLMRKSNDDIIN